MGYLCGSGVVCEAAHLLCSVELCAAACACLLLLLLLLHVGVPVVTAASFTTTTAFCWGDGADPPGCLCADAAFGGPCGCSA